MADALETRYYPMCYHTKFHCCRSKNLAVHSGSQKSWGCLAPPPWNGWPPINTLVPHVLPYQILLL